MVFITILVRSVLLLTSFGLLGGLLGLAPTALAFDFYSPGKIPDSKAPVSEIAAWAASIDYLGSRSLPKKLRPSDVITPFGSVINSETCLDGKTEEEKKAFIEIIESTLSETALRLSHCFNFYGFHEIPDAWATIRRTTYYCDKFPTNTPVYNPDKHSFVSLGSEMPLSKHEGAQSLTQTEWKATTIKFIHFIPTLASTSEVVYFTQSLNFNVVLSTSPVLDHARMSKRLFHESLHFLKTENTSWHNDVQRSSEDPANWDFYLRDRVYFMADACMPIANKSRNILSALYQITAIYPHLAYSVCKSALTSIDPLLEKSSYISANPYAPQEAESICTKIETFGKNIRKQNRDREVLENFFKFLMLY